ncbi:MAG: AraC family transcriptional regulator [Bacteroidetes bacterium]|nr:MAG: AraC family transcriptional regulator [Bacteroidota bacterium]
MSSIRTLASLPGTSSEIRFSSLCQHEKTFAFKGLAIKYVHHGREDYLFNGERFSLHAGEWILLNSTVEGQGWIDSREEVQGICIDLDPETVRETETVLRHEYAGMQELVFDGGLFVHKRQAAHAGLLPLMGRLAAQHTGAASLEADEARELFWECSKAVLLNQAQNQRCLPRLNVARPQTARVLMRRLVEARDLLSSEWALPPSVADLAREVGVSYYHFMRLFQRAFGLSPYQFSLQVRLRQAQQLLRESDRILDVAEACGFEDLSSFSRAFKKHSGLPPSAWQRRFSSF